MGEFVIRNATAGDAARVTSLLRASYPRLMAPVYGRKALSLMTRANPKLLASPGCFVAETPRGEIVGLGAWSFDYPGVAQTSPGVGHVRHFATHPDWTRRGVGRAIYSRCEAGARQAGVRVLECNASLNAEGFYAALGFRRLGQTNVELTAEVTIPAVRMRKSLGA